MILLSFIFFALLLPAQGRRCPDGWTIFGPSCYVYITNPTSWSSAQTICGLLGAHLPEIESAAENRFLTSMVVKLHGPTVWIGFNDFVHEGRYVWTSTNKPIEYSNWDSGEPNNVVLGVGDQDCGVLYKNGFWDDDFCEHRSSHWRTFFCEKSH
eukprot:TRINITY_DN110628_c0_g1_i4.p1 TRINITY_DN110628_c0_g1~~TRINITY_DN110628_c0_g1_i4.p1  ORF type:complete len:154 (-),score=18.21 TRINITY_DN110628_c0_g1_i4:180-641(-)